MAATAAKHACLLSGIGYSFNGWIAIVGTEAPHWWYRTIHKLNNSGNSKGRERDWAGAGWGERKGEREKDREEKGGGEERREGEGRD